MPSLKILFADDHIPPDSLWNLSEKALIENILEENPHWAGQPFLGGFHQVRQAVMVLRDAGYDITVANTFQDAKSKIQSTKFDIAIVDLGWAGDETLPQSERDSAGWRLSDEIENFDKNNNHKTLQLVYSSRFGTDNAIALQAADRSILPVVKTFDEAGRSSLLASIKFFDKFLEDNLHQNDSSNDQNEKLQDLYANYLKAPLRQQSITFYWMLVIASLSSLLILGGAFVALSSDQKLTGSLSSVAGILSTFLCRIVYKALEKRDSQLKSAFNSLKSEIKKMN